MNNYFKKKKEKKKNDLIVLSTSPRSLVISVYRYCRTACCFEQEGWSIGTSATFFFFVF